MNFSTNETVNMKNEMTYATEIFMYTILLFDTCYNALAFARFGMGRSCGVF